MLKIKYLGQNVIKVELPTVALQTIFEINLAEKQTITRAAVDGTPSQIPAFLPITFTLGSRSHKM